jgi:hypothetical protein
MSPFLVLRPMAKFRYPADRELELIAGDPGIGYTSRYQPNNS